MRVCHLNTCPVGVATQNPELRKKFKGGADAVVHFMNYVAEEVREIMAKLGFKSIDEMVGHVDRLELRSAIDHWKAQGLDYSKILIARSRPRSGHLLPNETRSLARQELDMTQILELAKPAIENGDSVETTYPSSTPTALSERSLGQKFLSKIRA